MATEFLDNDPSHELGAEELPVVMALRDEIEAAEQGEGLVYELSNTPTSATGSEYEFSDLSIADKSGAQLGAQRQGHIAQINSLARGTAGRELFEHEKLAVLGQTQDVLEIDAEFGRRHDFDWRVVAQEADDFRDHILTLFPDFEREKKEAESQIDTAAGYVDALWEKAINDDHISAAEITEGERAVQKLARFRGEANGIDILISPAYYSSVMARTERARWIVNKLSGSSEESTG